MIISSDEARQMKEMSLRLWGMVNIANFGKLFIDWFQQKKGSSKKENPFIQTLQTELQSVANFLNSMYTDLNENQPFLKTILLSEMECPIYKNSAAELGSLKMQTKKEFVQCFEAIDNFKQLCQNHNELFEKFVQIYIRNGLSLTGIKLYDPVKRPAYQEVNDQYQLVLQASQKLLSDCKQTNDFIQVTLNHLSQP